MKTVDYTGHSSIYGKQKHNVEVNYDHEIISITSGHIYVQQLILIRVHPRNCSGLG